MTTALETYDSWTDEWLRISAERRDDEESLNLCLRIDALIDDGRREIEAGTPLAWVESVLELRVEQTIEDMVAALPARLGTIASVED